MCNLPNAGKHCNTVGITFEEKECRSAEGLQSLKVNKENSKNCNHTKLPLPFYFLFYFTLKEPLFYFYKFTFNKRNIQDLHVKSF